MHVLVYFDENKQNVAYDTVALLCKQFVVELDLLVTDGVTDVTDWQDLTPAPVREVRGSGPLPLRVAALCAQRQYDLVVAALADHGGLLRLLLRSRVGQLVHAAPATVWVARGHALALRRIVVGLSGGPQTEQDVRLAILLAKTFGAMISLVHVASQLPLTFVTPDEYWASMRHNGLSTTDPAVANVVRAEELVKAAGVPVKVDIRAGIVLDELQAACAGGPGVSPADLLVVGAHRLTPAPGSPYLEDMAELVTQAVRVPTLVIHAESDWQVWNKARLARSAVAG